MTTFRVLLPILGHLLLEQLVRRELSYCCRHDDDISVLLLWYGVWMCRKVQQSCNGLYKASSSLRGRWYAKNSTVATIGMWLLTWNV